MEFFTAAFLNLDLATYAYAALVVLLASYVRGFSGFAGPMTVEPGESPFRKLAETAARLTET